MPLKIQIVPYGVTDNLKWHAKSSRLRKSISVMVLKFTIAKILPLQSIGGLSNISRGQSLNPFARVIPMQTFVK